MVLIEFLYEGKKKTKPKTNAPTQEQTHPFVSQRSPSMGHFSCLEDFNSLSEMGARDQFFSVHRGKKNNKEIAT